jgi:hypothetical protein
MTIIERGLGGSLKVSKTRTTLKVGTMVRIRQGKGVFDKRLPVWSDSIYKILAVEGLQYILIVGDKRRRLRREDVLPVVNGIKAKLRNMNDITEQLKKDTRNKKTKELFKRLDIDDNRITTGKRNRKTRVEGGISLHQ